jgi:hypothetical protein
MFVGTSPFAYAVLAGLVVIAALYFSYVNIFHTLRIVLKRPEVVVDSADKGNKRGDVVICTIQLAAIAVACTAVSTWFVQAAPTQVHQEMWLLTCAYLFLYVSFVDNLSSWFYNGTKGAGINWLFSKWYADPERAVAIFNTATAYCSLLVQLSAAVAYLYLYPDQSSTTMRSILSTTCALLFVILLFQFAKVYMVDSGKIKSSALYTALQENGAMRIKNIQVAADLSKLEGKTVKFAQTGNQTFPANDPDIAVLHHIEQQVLTKGPQYGLSVKNYAAIQKGNDNDFLVLRQEDAAELLAADPQAYTQNPKYGMLGGSASGFHTELGNKKVILLSKLSDSAESMYKPFSSHVSGFGVGWAASHGFSAWFPYLYTLFLLAYNIFTFRDGGVGLLYTSLTCLPALYMSWIGRHGQWFQLFALNQLVGISLVVYPYWNTGKYIMQTSIIGSTSNNSLQLTSVAMDNNYDAEFTGYFAFANACLFFILSFAWANWS